jgi:hypothetical protein
VVRGIDTGALPSDRHRGQPSGGHLPQHYHRRLSFAIGTRYVLTGNSIEPTTTATRISGQALCRGRVDDCRFRRILLDRGNPLLRRAFLFIGFAGKDDLAVAGLQVEVFPLSDRDH